MRYFLHFFVDKKLTDNGKFYDVLEKGPKVTHKVRAKNRATVHKMAVKSNS